MTEIEQLIEQAEKAQREWEPAPQKLSWQEIKRQYNLYFPRATIYVTL